MSAPVTFWWVRHGPTHAKTMIGWTDAPADLGDAARLARLSAYLPCNAPVISSDLSRAAATADAIAGTRPRLPASAALREMHFGSWEDRPFTEIQSEDPALLLAFWDQPGSVAPPGGESWDDLAARVGAAVDDLAGLGHDDIIVSAHFGVILTQVQRALGIAPKQAFAHHIENLSVTRLCLDGDWRAEQINHLP